MLEVLSIAHTHEKSWRIRPLAERRGSHTGDTSEIVGERLLLDV